MRFEIPEINIPSLKAKLEKLVKKAKKLNSGIIQYVFLDPIDYPMIWSRESQCHVTIKNPTVKISQEKITGYRRYIPIEITGETPKLNGWQFAAVLQRLELEDGQTAGMIRPCLDQPIPAELRERFGDCDHCKTNRMRNDVYIVRMQHPTESVSVPDLFKVVGSTCLKDFLGHDNPLSVAQMAEYIAEARELCFGAEEDGYFGYGERTPDVFDVDTVLRVAATIIDKDGFISRKKAKEDWKEESATANTLSLYFCVSKNSQTWKNLKERYQGTEQHEQDAENAREWARTLANSDNEYLYNLSLIARSSLIPLRNFGLACSLIPAYFREIGRNSDKKNDFSKSDFIAHEKDRVTLPLQYLYTGTAFSTMYGASYPVHFKYTDPAGAQHKVTWFTGSENDEMTKEPGQITLCSFTVKKHELYKGIRQTIVSRVTVAKPKKPSKNKTTAV